jgi:hypothetical protein
MSYEQAQVMKAQTDASKVELARRERILMRKEKAEHRSG